MFFTIIHTGVIGLHETKRSIVDGYGEEAEVVCVTDACWRKHR